MESEYYSEFSTSMCYFSRSLEMIDAQGSFHMESFAEMVLFNSEEPVFMDCYESLIDSGDQELEFIDCMEEPLTDIDESDKYLLLILVFISE